MNLAYRSATSATDAMMALVDAAAAGIEEQARQRPVIVVFGLGSFGDVIQITPLLRALKKRFPQSAVVLVHHDAVGAKLLEGAPYLAKYLRLRSGLHYLLRSRLREESYDLMVECRYVIKYTLSQRARFDAGDLQFIRETQAVQKSWLHLVQNFPFDNDLLWRAAKAKGWSMYGLMAATAGFGGEDFEALQIDLPEGEAMTKKFLLPPRYVVVSNAAEWLPLQSALWTKCLPHAKMKEVLRGLKDRGIPTVLLGTANDPGSYAVDYDLRGKTKLLEAAEIVREARGVLGPEGGLVNLAKALQVPAVVFFGSTPVEFFGFKANLNVVPRYCGGCWWSTESYLRQCPLLEEIPPCTASLDTERIVQGVGELYLR